MTVIPLPVTPPSTSRQVGTPAEDQEPLYIKALISSDAATLRRIRAGEWTSQDVATAITVLDRLAAGCIAIARGTAGGYVYVAEDNTTDDGRVRFLLSELEASAATIEWQSGYIAELTDRLRQLP